MTISPFLFCDTTPLNFGNIGTDGTGSYLPLVFPQATTIGSTFVVFAGKALNGTTLVGTCSDPVNGSYGAAVESQPAIGGGNASWKSWVFQNAASLGPGDVGQATTTSGTSLTNTSKAWITNQWAGTTLIDLSSNRTYPILSNTATVLTFAAATAPVNNCSYVVGAFVRLDVTGAQGFGDYSAGVVFELTAAALSGGIAHSSGLNTTGGAGTGNITSGAVACGSSPGTMVGISFNAVGASSPFVPLADTTGGFSDLGAFFTEDNGQTTLRVESQHFASPGTQAALFNAQGADQFGTFMVFAQDLQVGGARLAWIR